MLISVSCFCKCYNALIKGRITYCSAFLPELTFLSALIIPPWIFAKSSFMRTKEHFWVHVVCGPLFFVLTACTLIVGSDYAGLGGTDFLNLAFSGGNENCQQAIIFSRRSGYQFPIVVLSAKNINKLLNSHVLLADREVASDDVSDHF
jgi:hypothetical protein